MRRFSQAISEGDGISLIAPAPDAQAAQDAERQGAEGVVVERDLAGLRDATGLPILWRADGSPAEALNGGADALLVAAQDLEDDAERLERRCAEAQELGLECVVEVRDDDELELALERLDPEIFLLAPEDGATPTTRSSTCSTCCRTSRPESSRSPISRSRRRTRSPSSSVPESTP